MGGKQNKYYYCKVIQQNFGGGWEDVSEYECDSQGRTKEKVEKVINGRTIKVSLLKLDLKEYELGNNYPTRVIFRKQLATK